MRQSDSGYAEYPELPDAVVFTEQDIDGVDLNDLTKQFPMGLVLVGSGAKPEEFANRLGRHAKREVELVDPERIRKISKSSYSPGAVLIELDSTGIDADHLLCIGSAAAEAVEKLGIKPKLRSFAMSNNASTDAREEEVGPLAAEQRRTVELCRMRDESPEVVGYGYVIGRHRVLTADAVLVSREGTSSGKLIIRPIGKNSEASRHPPSVVLRSKRAIVLEAFVEHGIPLATSAIASNSQPKVWITFSVGGSQLLTGNFEYANGAVCLEPDPVHSDHFAYLLPGHPLFEDLGGNTTLYIGFYLGARQAVLLSELREDADFVSSTSLSTPEAFYQRQVAKAVAAAPNCQTQLGEALNFYCGKSVDDHEKIAELVCESLDPLTVSKLFRDAAKNQSTDLNRMLAEILSWFLPLALYKFIQSTPLASEVWDKHFIETNLRWPVTSEWAMALLERRQVLLSKSNNQPSLKGSMDQLGAYARPFEQPPVGSMEPHNWPQTLKHHAPDFPDVSPEELGEYLESLAVQGKTRHVPITPEFRRARTLDENARHEIQELAKVTRLRFLHMNPPSGPNPVDQDFFHNLKDLLPLLPTKGLDE